MESFGVLSRSDHQRCCDVSGHAVFGEQGGDQRFQERPHLGLEFSGFDIEGLPAAREPPDRCSGSGASVDDLTGSPASGRADPMGRGQPAKLGANVVRCGEDQIADLIRCDGLGLDGGTTGHPQCSDCLDLPGPITRGGCCFTGEHRSSCRLGISRIGLAASTAMLTVHTVDLDHLLALSDQETSEASSI